MNGFTACCGLDCEKCDARIATINDDNELREKTAKLWTELNGVEITPYMINCTGCRISGAKTPFCDSLCEIRKCAREKGFNTCADCDYMEQCNILKPIISINAQAFKNLMVIKQNNA